ncbi:MAG: amidase [Thaumarchaeota archaeon]|nr:amidase [Nitrososphaerota archaeon]
MVRARRNLDAADDSSIAAYRKRLLSGDTSCEERVREELTNIEAYDRRFNAFIMVFGGDKGLALSRARVLDARLARRDRGPLSPLFGVPLTIKDNAFLGGLPATDGSEAFSDFVPQTNAEVVDQTLEAGCIPLGKTNLHELALGIMGTSGYGGPIHNPVDPARVSGGSSGGSAVSVALSKGAILSIGSDTGGSVRVPAALCGVCGFKPSQGVLSTEGLFPLSGTLDHAGLLARSVPDVALGFRTITGSRPLPKRRHKLGVPTRYFVDDMDSQVSKEFWRAVDLLKESGEFEMKQVAVEKDYLPFSRARAIIQLKEAAWFYESLLRSPETRKKMHKDVLALMDRGMKMGMIQYMHSINLRLEFLQVMSRLLKGIDAILMPTCLVVAPKIEDALGNETGQLRSLMLRNAELFNLSGLPALSLPAARRSGALPVGLQLIGGAREDERVLAASESAWSVLHGPRSYQ